jgi:phosphate transport system substrate-binding protein
MPEHPAPAPATPRPSAAAWVAVAVGTLLLAAFAVSGCRKADRTGTTSSGRTVIQNIGSDTMVNIAQSWAEAYQSAAPGVSVEVSGGGSGLGIAALLNGTADVANSSRHIEEKEVKRIVEKTGAKPTEFLVGFDALSIFVHPDNPITAISMEELRAIYAEGSTVDTWAQLGIPEIPGARTNRIIRVSRQNNSGTYHYFRETVLGKKADMKPGSLDMNGSKEVVELVSRTPGAIGYSGLGYATSKVKVVKVSKRKGEPGVMPSRTSIHDKSYPISRPLFMVTPSTPKPSAQAYLDFVLSPEGQELVLSTGYVPLS